MKHLRIHLTEYTNILLTQLLQVSFVLQISHSTLAITLTLSATNKNYENNNFWVASGPCHKKLVILLNMTLFSHLGCSRCSHINLKSEIVNLKWVNLKYKTDCFIWTERELHWCHFAFKYSAQWSVERISYVITLDPLHIERQRVNKFT